MSIIIRLQNLPWSANSADIRHFFEGLVIPDGGVHIIGGEKGDAFIAFQCDEDARIAMQKNGLRLKDNRVKLFLSSRSEMQQLIERVRKGYVEEPILGHGYLPEDHLKLSEQITFRPRSPDHLRHRSGERSRHSSPRRAVRSRSSSRHRDGTRDSDRYRYSHRSGRSEDEPRSSSPRHNQGRRDSIDRYMEKSAEFLRETGRASQLSADRAEPPEIRYVSSVPSYDQHSLMEQLSGPPVSNPTSIGSAENLDMFAKYIASKIIRGEPLCDKSVIVETTKSDYLMDNFESPGSFVPRDSKSDFPEVPSETVWQPDTSARQNFPPDSFNDNRFLDRGEKIFEGPFQGGRQMEDSFNRFPSQVGNPSDRGLYDYVQPAHDMRKPMPMTENFCETQPNYCVRLSGLPSNANFKTVQALLKGIYAPMHNIKWDVNARGQKNGIALIKLSNKEDFYNVLDMKELTFEGKPVCLERCPDEIFYDFFGVTSSRAHRGKRKRSNQEYCYMLKGLPYATTESDLMDFFTGLNLVDLLILYEKNGKATGSGYVQFASSADYTAAFERNGKKIGRRYIELFPSNRADMDDARNAAAAVSKPMSDVLNEQMFQNRVRSYKQNALQKRPLCVVLSGLPSTVKNSDIFGFFNSCGIRPDAVHNILNEINSSSSGRAFVEFFDLFDLDVALKQHGKYLGQSMVSVKQVLFEEMMRILETHPVQHDYGIVQKQSEELDSGPVPEKLPYIWEPPDTKEDTRTSSAQFPWKNPDRRPNFDYSKESSFPHNSVSVGTSKSFFTRSDHLRNEMGSKPDAFESQWYPKGDSDRNIAMSKDPYSNFGVRLHHDAGAARGMDHPFYETRNMMHEDVKSKMDFEQLPPTRKDYGGSNAFDHRSVIPENSKEFTSGVPFSNRDQNIGKGSLASSRESFGLRSDYKLSDSQHISQRHIDYADSHSTREFSPYGINSRKETQLHFENRQPFGYPDDHISNTKSSHFVSEEVHRYAERYEKGHFDNKRAFGNRDSREDHPRSHKHSDQPRHYSTTAHLDSKESSDYYDGSKEKSKFSSRKPFDQQQRRSNFDGASFHTKESFPSRNNKDEGIISGASLTDDKNRNPVKFGVKPRHTVTANEKMRDAFGPEASKEEKRQLKKLSPERQQTDRSGKQTSSKAGSTTDKKQGELKPKEESSDKDQSNSRKAMPVASGNLRGNKNQKDQFEKSKSSDKKNPSGTDKKDLNSNDKKDISEKKASFNTDKWANSDKDRKTSNDSDKRAPYEKDKKTLNDSDKKVPNEKDKKSLSDKDKKASNDKDKKASNDRDKKASNDKDRKVSNDEKKISNNSDKKVSNDNDKKSSGTSGKGKGITTAKGKAINSVAGRRRRRTRHRRWSPKRGEGNLDPFLPEEMRNMDIFQVPGYQPPFCELQTGNQGYSALAPFESGGCIVQASNVSPYVGLDELLHFFSGFHLRGQDVIRRFTDTGEPTGDVRIAFQNSHEARQAVTLLNNRLLAGAPVALFYV